MKAVIPILRGGTYGFRKRVPCRYRVVEPLSALQLSLRTDSLEVAHRKVPEVWGALINV